MYQQLKKIVKHFIPDKLLFQIEFPIRKIYSVFYLGKNVFCPVCENGFSKFILLNDGDLKCARCGSLARQRRLWMILMNEIKPGKNDVVLHLSPSRSIQKKLRKNSSFHYVTSEYEKGSGADKNYDLTSIDERAEKYSVIICYHILEHIPDDKKAMKELFRILKPNGVLLVQTPFQDGNIYEDFSLTTSSERLKYFGQEDHVRIYSVAGLKQRLEEATFQVEVKFFTGDVYLGLKKNEVVLFCSK
jgi:SAM-dependent methyltransferase